MTFAKILLLIYLLSVVNTFKNFYYAMIELENGEAKDKVLIMGFDALKGWMVKASTNILAKIFTWIFVFLAVVFCVMFLAAAIPLLKIIALIRKIIK